jgi:hypothetical protein
MTARRRNGNDSPTGAGLLSSMAAPASTAHFSAAAAA